MGRAPSQLVEALKIEVSAGAILVESKPIVPARCDGEAAAVDGDAVSNLDFRCETRRSDLKSRPMMFCLECDHAADFFDQTGEHMLRQFCSQQLTVNYGRAIFSSEKNNEADCCEYGSERRGKQTEIAKRVKHEGLKI